MLYYSFIISRRHFLGRKKKKSMYILPYRVRFSLNIQSHHNAHYLGRPVMQWVSIAQNSQLLPPHLVPLQYRCCHRHFLMSKVVCNTLILLPCHWEWTGGGLVSIYQNCKCVYHLPQNPTFGNLFHRTSPECVKWLVHQVTHCRIVCHSTWREASHCGVNLKSPWRGPGSPFCDSRSKDMTQTETGLSTEANFCINF